MRTELCCKIAAGSKDPIEKKQSGFKTTENPANNVHIYTAPSYCCYNYTFLGNMRVHITQPY